MRLKSPECGSSEGLFKVLCRVTKHLYNTNDNNIGINDTESEPILGGDPTECDSCGCVDKYREFESED